MIPINKGTSPIALSAGNSGACSAIKGIGKINRITDIEMKQQMFMKYMISHGISSHRVQQVPPVHIITSRRFDRIEYLKKMNRRQLMVIVYNNMQTNMIWSMLVILPTFILTQIRNQSAYPDRNYFHPFYTRVESRTSFRKHFVELLLRTQGSLRTNPRLLLSKLIQLDELPL